LAGQQLLPIQPGGEAKPLEAAIQAIGGVAILLRVSNEYARWVRTAKYNFARFAASSEGSQSVDFQSGIAREGLTNPAG
jgi:hypothetical protein